MVTEMETITQPARSHWDRRAHQYGTSRKGYKAICSYGAPYLYNKYIDLIQKKVFFSAIRSLNIRGKKVLDAGCGVGRWSRILARKGAEVTGADISKEMIRVAKEIPANETVRFIVSPVSQIDQSLGSFDLVTCVTVLQHVTDKEEFQRSVRNLVKLTKRGGKMLIIEVAPSESQSGKDFNDHLSVRPDKMYLNAFKEAGASLENTYSMDVVPFKQQVISLSAKIPKPIYQILLHIALFLSIVPDCLFSGTRFFTKYSWHKAFLFSIIDKE